MSPLEHTNHPCEIAPATMADEALRRERSQRGRSANNRGKETERAVVRWLRENGFPGAERSVRTGYRTASRTSRDEGDITGTPGLCFQVKSKETDNVAAWLDETLHQRQAASADVGVLIVRRAGKSDPGRWWAWVPLLFLHGTVGDRRTWMTPVRLELADLVTLLRSRGYGDPLPEGPEQASALRAVKQSREVTISEELAAERKQDAQDFEAFLRRSPFG